MKLVINIRVINIRVINKLEINILVINKLVINILRSRFFGKVLFVSVGIVNNL